MPQILFYSLRRWSFILWLWRVMAFSSDPCKLEPMWSVSFYFIWSVRANCTICCLIVSLSKGMLMYWGLCSLVVYSYSDISCLDCHNFEEQTTLYRSPSSNWLFTTHFPFCLIVNKTYYRKSSSSCRVFYRQFPFRFTFLVFFNFTIFTQTPQLHKEITKNTY